MKIEIDPQRILEFCLAALQAGWGWIVLVLFFFIILMLILLYAKLRLIDRKIDTLQAIALKESWNQFS